jgi:hypothetical protein
MFNECASNGNGRATFSVVDCSACMFRKAAGLCMHAGPLGSGALVVCDAVQTAHVVHAATDR